MARSPRTSRTAPAASSRRQLRIRMYRHGLGDCFLLSLPGAGGTPFHMMIDCGLILGTQDLDARLGAVLDDVIATTGGKLDVLVVTHEHFDHVAAFSRLPEKFALPGQPEAGKLWVGATWFAWTEDPSDKLAGDIRQQRAVRKQALAGLVGRLDGMGAGAPETPQGVAAALEFFGVSGKGKADGTDLGATAQAMVNAAGFAPKEKVRYFNPGDIWTDPAVPGIRILVLGPPKDRKLMGRTDSTTEVYHLDAGGLEDSVKMAAAAGGDESNPDPFCPFEKPYQRNLSALKASLENREDGGPMGAFLAETYFNPEAVTPETDQSWRRIDDAWMGSAEQLALALDSSTNNTSLALAIEIVATKEVLLFPGDAQVGNWMSWHDVKWDGFTTAELLTRTKFYKVGHHGSHNATLKAKGLEMMPDHGLTAFIPVDHETAVKKKWFEMPLDALLKALHERCGDAVIRIDGNLPSGVVGVTAGGINGPFDTLYYDWTCDVPTPS